LGWLIGRKNHYQLTIKSPTLTTHEIDPDVDEVRDYLNQDLLESQKLAILGFVGGVGQAASENQRYNLTDSFYLTDGMGVVFVLRDETTALDEVQFFDWERI
jgi:hypothetical protein